MKKSEIISLINSLSSCNNLTGARFSYACARNVALLQPESKAFEETRKILVESYAKKNKDGKPEIKDNQYVLEDPALFQKEFAKLLDEEVDIKLFQIDFSEVPEGINVAQMQGILPIIKQEETKKAKK